MMTPHKKLVTIDSSPDVSVSVTGNKGDIDGANDENRQPSTSKSASLQPPQLKPARMIAKAEKRDYRSLKKEMNRLVELLELTKNAQYFRLQQSWCASLERVPPPHSLKAH